MINYYEELSPEEQRRVTESVQALYRQTFLQEQITRQLLEML